MGSWERNGELWKDWPHYTKSRVIFLETRAYIVFFFIFFCHRRERETEGHPVFKLYKYSSSSPLSLFYWVWNARVTSVEFYYIHYDYHYLLNVEISQEGGITLWRNKNGNYILTQGKAQYTRVEFSLSQTPICIRLTDN